MGSLRQQSEGIFGGIVLDRAFQLEESDEGIWHLHFADHNPLELDLDETDAIFRLSQTHNEVEQLSMAGVNFYDSNELTAHQALLSQVPLGESILLDVTTLFSALHATQELFINPFALLDLSVVTYAFAMFDNVLVQAHRSRLVDSTDSRFGDALVEITPDRETISGPLWSICAKTINRLNSKDAQIFADAWGTFLGRDDVKISGSAVDLLQDSPLKWDGVPASYYSTQALSADVLTKTGSDDSLMEYLSVQTVRALFNDQLAAMMRVPYVSTTLRSPVYSTLLSKKVETQMLADKLLARLGSEALLEPSQGQYVLETSAPFLLGLLLSRMKSPAEYWSELQDLRDDLKPRPFK